MKTYQVSMKISRTFHVTVTVDENATLEEIKDLVIDAFEEEDFGELCVADIEDFNIK